MTISADPNPADSSHPDFYRIEIDSYLRSLIFSATLDLAFYPDICNITIGDDENIVTYQSGDLGVRSI